MTVTEKARVGSGGSIGRIVTLVRLLPHAEAEDRARDAFIEKGQALMRLSGTAVAETLELGRAKTHYIAREHVAGVSLRRLSRITGEDGMSLPVGFACDVIVQLCGTLLAV